MQPRSFARLSASAPEIGAALAELLPWRAFDERGELYVNAASVGFVIEIPPFAGIDAETLGALSGTLADAAPERCTVQVIHWASPRFGAAAAPPPGRRGLAGAASGRAAVHAVGLPGVRLRLAGGNGGEVAVRVLSAIAFPEVWPGWRGNALIGDFQRDFLQPGCPVLTCLTVMTGEAADGEKAFLKSARAIQQAGTGIARYLPGLAEKARDWQFVTERLKDGERLIRACYMVAVYAPLDALDEAEQAVRAIYHGQGWRVSAERYAQLPSWLACLPMAAAAGLDADLARLGRMKDVPPPPRSRPTLSLSVEKGALTERAVGRRCSRRELVMTAGEGWKIGSLRRCLPHAMRHDGAITGIGPEARLANGAF